MTKQQRIDKTSYEKEKQEVAAAAAAAAAANKRQLQRVLLFGEACGQ